MTIGFDAPLPPAATGVADYAAVLLGELSRLTTVVLPGAKADRWLYHIGNNREHHAAIYARALARPGVVVLHDAVLMHLHLSMAAGEDAFVEEFVYNYGRWHDAHARRLWRDRARSGADAEYFRWEMLKRLAGTAQAVIVHNPGAARRVRQHAPDARVIEIPHISLDVRASAARALEFRRSWRCGSSTFVFGVFGHLRESKRVLPILRALSPLLDGDVRLVLCGAAGSEGMERAIETELRPNVERMPALADEGFRAALSAVDAGLSLRSPPAGETSGITIRLMAAGKPVLVTRGEETSGLPDGACVKIEPGAAEETHLLEAARWLATQPAFARRVGALAAEHIALHHAPSLVARRYLEVLTS